MAASSCSRTLSGSQVSWPDALITNLRLLGFKPSPGDPDVAFNLFQRPNKRAFQGIILFLFDALDEAESAGRFDSCRRCLSRRQEVNFAKVCCAWLSDLAEEGRLPRVTPSMVTCPQGDKIYELLAKLSTVVLRRRVLSLGVPERDLVSPGRVVSRGLHSARRTAMAKKCAVAALAEERQALLTRLDQIQREEAARRVAMERLCERHRRAGEEEARISGLVAGCSGGSGLGQLDSARLAHLEQLWRQLSCAVEELDPARNSVSALRRQEEEERRQLPGIDGSALSVQVPRVLQRPEAPPVYREGKLDLSGLLHHTKTGAELLSRRSREKAPAGNDIEKKARDCLTCLQRQVGQLEGLVERGGTTLLPSLRTSVEELRLADRSRHQLSPHSEVDRFVLPTLNGDVSASSSPSPRFLPPRRSSIGLDDSLGSADHRPTREPPRPEPSPRPSPSPAPSIRARLHSARRLLAAEQRRLSSPVSSARSDTLSPGPVWSPRGDVTFNSSEEAEDIGAAEMRAVEEEVAEVMTRMRLPAVSPVNTSSPAERKLTPRFRLSLDRLGLQDSDDEFLTGLVEETSSILLSSSRSDLLDDGDIR